MEEIIGEIEDKIFDILNEADNLLSKTEFDNLSQSIIDYINEISKSKK